MKPAILCAVLGAAILVASCNKQENAAAPPPFALTQDAMGRYCGMNVLEHPGPKGQIILQQVPEAIWFSSARDTLAFTMLPEEPRDIAAIYVSDMSKAPTWDEPGAENWIDAKTAFFVIGSARRGGMGTEEAVPFSSEADARAFAGEHGGRVVRFEEMPQDYILGSGAQVPPEGTGAAEETTDTQGHNHG